METVRICKGNREDISCKPGNVINIITASYGRSSKFSRCSWSTTNFCHASTSLEIVTKRCQYKRSCTLFAQSTIFGNPCPGVGKYLKVQYDCMPEDTTVDTTYLNTTTEYFPSSFDVTSSFVTATATAGDALKLGVILGPVVGGLLLLAVVLFMAFYHFRNRSTKSVKAVSVTKSSLGSTQEQQRPRAPTTIEPEYEEINENVQSQVSNPTLLSVTDRGYYEEPIRLSEISTPLLVSSFGYLTMQTRPSIPGESQNGNEVEAVAEQETVVKQVRGQIPPE